jgi:hypothetical protein
MPVEPWYCAQLAKRQEREAGGDAYVAAHGCEVV